MDLLSWYSLRIQLHIRWLNVLFSVSWSPLYGYTEVCAKCFNQPEFTKCFGFNQPEFKHCVLTNQGLRASFKQSEFTRCFINKLEFASHFLHQQLWPGLRAFLRLALVSCFYSKFWLVHYWESTENRTLKPRRLTINFFCRNSCNAFLMKYFFSFQTDPNFATWRNGWSRFCFTLKLVCHCYLTWRLPFYLALLWGKLARPVMARRTEGGDISFR